MAVGGATYTAWDKLNAASIKRFVDEFGLDGVDIDYEVLIVIAIFIYNQPACALNSRLGRGNQHYGGVPRVTAQRDGDFSRWLLPPYTPPCLPANPAAHPAPAARSPPLPAAPSPPLCPLCAAPLTPNSQGW